MALFTDLTETDEITTGDQVLLHQGTTDKRIEANALSALYFAKRNGYLYYGEHELEVVYNTIESFYTYGGLTYFPKIDTTLPHTSPNANPANDSKLTTVPYGVYKRSVDATRYVGSTIMSFDATDPNDKFPWQTWVLVTGDASIRLGDGTSQEIVPTGNNEPEVPVVAHVHGMTHTHTGETSENGEHVHTLQDQRTSDGVGSPFDTNGGFPKGEANTDSAGAHTHSLDIDDYTGSTGSTGTDNATLDVRGAYVKMNVWLRTA